MTCTCVPFVRRRLLVVCGVLAVAGPAAPQPAPADLRFEVVLDASLPVQPAGRLLVVLGADDQVEPGRRIGRTGRRAAPTFGVDAPALGPGDRVTVGAAAAAFPLASLADLPTGDYVAQAVLVTNRDLRSPNAPGNLFSTPRRVTIDAAQTDPIRLTLSDREPAEQLPPDDADLRFIRIRSELLSAFHGRPIFLRAGVILPRGFDQEPERRYPLRVRIGGYGERYTAVASLMRPGSPFHAAWTADGAPRMLLLHLDGAGPFGDPYQIDSANNGPYGEVITRELIPYVEREFRGIGTGQTRVLDGGSTGGWVSLALQIFYPDLFNGAWASCPDSVDFRAFQLVDIYGDENAYLDAQGAERASARNLDGNVRFTMRHELQMENVLGDGDRWTTSGRQWGAWNAAYGPRGADGRPVPLWDPQTGAIDHAVARQWQRYDLARVIAQNRNELIPKLRGKLNIWVGELDDYFLNDAVHLFERLLQTLPTLDARIAYGPGRGHCWTGISPAEMLQEMAAAVR